MKKILLLIIKYLLSRFYIFILTGGIFILYKNNIITADASIVSFILLWICETLEDIHDKLKDNNENKKDN